MKSDIRSVSYVPKIPATILKIGQYLKGCVRDAGLFPVSPIDPVEASPRFGFNDLIVDHSIPNTKQSLINTSVLDQLGFRFLFRCRTL